MKPKCAVGDTLNDVRIWLKFYFHSINLAMIYKLPASQRLDRCDTLDEICRKVFNNAGTHAPLRLFLLKSVNYLGDVSSVDRPCLLCTYIHI